MQENIQALIRKYEGEITLLLSQKSKVEINDPLYAICEISVLAKQTAIEDLRGIL